MSIYHLYSISSLLYFFIYLPFAHSMMLMLSYGFIILFVVLKDSLNAAIKWKWNGSVWIRSVAQKKENSIGYDFFSVIFLFYLGLVLLIWAIISLIINKLLSFLSFTDCHLFFITGSVTPFNQRCWAALSNIRISFPAIQAHVVIEFVLNSPFVEFRFYQHTSLILTTRVVDW